MMEKLKIIINNKEYSLYPGVVVVGNYLMCQLIDGDGKKYHAKIVDLAKLSLIDNIIKGEIELFSI